MAHPFVALFEKTLRKSTPEDNQLLKKAQEIVDKGYHRDEVGRVLDSMRSGRLDDDEIRIIDLALCVIREEEETF
ncbi:MAG TPA: hypothetical protein VFV22_03340 [Candidatus Paceibacterota bacterium]|nr:hypothetical protein [Candidatus Paceibacterota bacterium]